MKKYLILILLIALVACTKYLAVTEKPVTADQANGKPSKIDRTTSLSLINIGTNPNDGTGDALRTLAIKANAGLTALNAIPILDVVATAADINLTHSMDLTKLTGLGPGTIEERLNNTTDNVKLTGIADINSIRVGGVGNSVIAAMVLTSNGLAFLNETGDTIAVTNPQQSYGYIDDYAVMKDDSITSKLYATRKYARDEGGGGAGEVTLAGVETLTNKTLNSPKINENVVLTAKSTELNLLTGKTALGTAAAQDVGYFATAAQGTDARTPTSHTHGSITNGGLIGTTANLPLITGTGGLVGVGSFGTSANTFTQGNDSRLTYSDATSSIQGQLDANANTIANTETFETAALDTAVMLSKYALKTFVSSTGNDNYLKGLQALGSTIKAIPLAMSVYGQDHIAMVDGHQTLMAVYLPQATTLTGVGFELNLAGDYTADHYNGIGLFSYSAGSLTLVASSTDDGNLWKATADTYTQKAFSSTYNAAAGVYYVACLYNNSAQTTAPQIYTGVAYHTGAIGFSLTNSAKLCAEEGTYSVLTNVAMSAENAYGQCFGLFLY